jgi:putative acetyltransferase
VPEAVISIEDPRAADVRELLGAHLAYARANSPPEAVHALELDGLTEAGVSFFTYRSGGELLCVAALRELDPAHAEIKSMHTALEARGRGIGRAMLAKLLEIARARGYERVSLETGSQDAFAPARALYAQAGFQPCAAFGSYAPSEHSVFMTRAL